jgi:hypothetical protein
MLIKNVKSSFKKTKFPSYKTKWDLRGRDRMVVGFTTAPAITAKVVSSNPTHGEMYSIQHYVIKFLSYFWQVSDFL